MISGIIAYIHCNKHAFFLGSLLFLLIGDVFFPSNMQRLATVLIISQNMLFSLPLLRDKSKKVRTVFYVFITLDFFRLCAEAIGYSFAIDRLTESLFSIYFIFLAIILFYDLYRTKQLSMDSVYAVFNGFIMLSFAFGFILMFMNNITPGSLNGIDENAAIFDYIYFSFITLMTIGYGDITPNTELARKIVVFAALVGHFYTVFVTALIIGKLFSQAKE